MKALNILLTILFSIALVFSQTSGGEFTKENLRKTNTELTKLYQEKNYDKAIPIAEKLVLMNQNINGENHIETANALKILGYIQFLKDNKKDAEKNLEKAFKVFEKISNLSQKTGKDVAKMLETLATIKYEENLKSGEKYFKTALEWREKYNGKDSPETLVSLAALANISYWDKDYKKSAELFQRVVEIGMKESDLAADIDVAYYRAQCSFKKTDNLKGFEQLKSKYTPQTGQIKFNPDDKMPVTKRVPKVINGGVVNGKAVSLPAPVYPREAKMRGARGTATVQVLINETGDIISACTISKVDPLLAEAAEYAAYSAKFRPTTLSGNPVRVSGVITYVFN